MIRLPRTSSDGQLQFAAAWMQSHINDAGELGMPVIFTEFGVSTEDGKLNQSFRDAFIEVVYETLLNSTRRGGPGAGGLLWQLFPEGVDYMDDGYAVVLSESPATASVLSRQSWRLQIFNAKCSWKCRWICRKEEDENPPEQEDELSQHTPWDPLDVESERKR